MEALSLILRLNQRIQQHWRLSLNYYKTDETGKFQLMKLIHTQLPFKFGQRSKGLGCLQNKCNETHYQACETSLQDRLVEKMMNLTSSDCFTSAVYFSAKQHVQQNMSIFPFWVKVHCEAKECLTAQPCHHWGFEKVSLTDMLNHIKVFLVRYYMHKRQKKWKKKQIYTCLLFL